MNYITTQQCFICYTSMLMFCLYVTTGYVSMTHTHDESTTCLVNIVLR